MLLPIEKTIFELADLDQPLPNLKLTELSNLTQEDLSCLRRSWPAIDTRRRRQIMRRLVELAENNFELNFDAIFRYCLKDADDEVRGTAIEGLWENESATLIEPLITLLEQDSSEKVQVSAALALGKFAMLAEDNKLRDCYVSRIQDSLLKVINNESKPVELRRRALESAAPLSIPQVKTAIMEAYQSENPRLKVSAIHSMGKNCDLSWLPVLIKELGSMNNEIRYEAAWACGELEEEEAVPSLIRLVGDSDADVQMAAILALGKIGGNRAKECLEYCLDNASEAIAQTAEEALYELETGGDSLFPPLKK